MDSNGTQSFLLPQYHQDSSAGDNSEHRGDTYAPGNVPRRREDACCRKGEENSRSRSIARVSLCTRPEPAGMCGASRISRRLQVADLKDSTSTKCSCNLGLFTSHRGVPGTESCLCFCSSQAAGDGPRTCPGGVPGSLQLTDDRPCHEARCVAEAEEGLHEAGPEDMRSAHAWSLGTLPWKL